jgi:hypothetical protein
MTRLGTLLICTLAATGCDQASDGIGPRGGEIVSADGRLTLTVPEGALDQTVAIEIAEVTDRPDGAVGPAYELLPAGTSFTRPATVTFELEDDDLQYYSDLALVSHKEDQWYYMADRDLDVEDMTLSASAAYLSAFAVVGDIID